MNTGTLTVNFVSGAANAGQLAVEVDEVATGINPPYPPGSAVVLRLFGRGSAAITPTSLGCSLALTAAGQTLTKTEILTIINSDTLSLSLPAISVPAITWLASNGTPGSYSLDPADAATVKFSKPIVMGICEASYNVSYDKYRAANLSGQKALLLFTASDGRDVSIELEIKQPDPVKKDLTITIKDYSTDVPIPFANVTLSGPYSYQWSGQSDVDGVISLNNLSSGDYTLTATAALYQSTGSDILANDRFTL